jgi:hypothetical protein
MGLGLGILLVVVGLVLVTGVLDQDLGFVEDTALGWILLAAGVLTLVLGLAMNRQRARTHHVEEHRGERH